jgi:hypothetical protein
MRKFHWDAACFVSWTVLSLAPLSFSLHDASVADDFSNGQGLRSEQMDRVNHLPGWRELEFGLYAG